MLNTVIFFSPSLDIGFGQNVGILLASICLQVIFLLTFKFGVQITNFTAKVHFYTFIYGGLILATFTAFYYLFVGYLLFSRLHDLVLPTVMEVRAGDLTAAVKKAISNAIAAHPEPTPPPVKPKPPTGNSLVLAERVNHRPLADLQGPHFSIVRKMRILDNLPVISISVLTGKESPSMVIINKRDVELGDKMEELKNLLKKSLSW